jgi:hypothetical protein
MHDKVMSVHMSTLFISDITQHSLVKNDLKLSQLLNSMKSSQAISHIKHLYKTDVLRTSSVPIIRDQIEYFNEIRYWGGL